MSALVTPARELKVYRISGPGTGRSMWYDMDGKFSPILPELEAVPMDIDPFRLHLQNDWLSAVDQPDLLEKWFPGLLPQLTALGFITREFIATEWHQLPNEIVFNSETAVEVTQ